MLIWFLDGVRLYRQIYLEEINSVGDGVDCWIVFKTATKLTSVNCTTSALILALTCTSTFCRHVNVDVDVDVVVHVVDFQRAWSQTKLVLTCTLQAGTGTGLNLNGLTAQLGLSKV